jgi:hypothetical protein
MTAPRVEKKQPPGDPSFAAQHDARNAGNVGFSPSLSFVLAGLVPAVRGFAGPRIQDVDARHQAGMTVLGTAAAAS